MHTNCLIAMTLSSLAWLYDSLTNFLALMNHLFKCLGQSDGIKTQCKPFRKYVVNVVFILGDVK